MPTRVAVLGGGMGALAAAWRLVEAGGYDVTVYQRGWRLGGKGASGRDARAHDAIQEHGLHILMGFYDNAFHLLRRCYDAAPPTGGHGTLLPWGEGVGRTFTAVDRCAFAQEWRDGWDFLEVPFPSRPDEPWDTPRAPSALDLFEAGLHVFHDLLDAFGRLPLVPAIRLPLPRVLAGLTAWAIEGVLVATWNVAEPLLRFRDVRWLWMALAFVGGNLIGALRDGLLGATPDFASIDDRDYREWLRDHLRGVRDFFGRRPDPRLTWQSPFVAALYDLAFSDRTTLAAGVTLNVILRLGLDYRGHVGYRMNAGMGDVVFAPLYLALKQRGVRFRFFHRVLEVRTDGTVVTEIDVEEQVAAAAGYDPLVTVRDHPAWPGEPDAAQLPPAYRAAVAKAGRAPYDFERDPAPAPAAFGGGRRTLRRGTGPGDGDFDVVVLGISVGALRGLCPTLCAANPAFAAMCDGLATIPTQAVQVWLESTPADLDARAETLAISFVRPFNSWADMSQVVPSETWPARVRHVSYFCDAYHGSGPDPQQEVDANADRFLRDALPRLWPGFRPGTTPIVHRYTRVNVDASDRYVLTECGGTRHRLRADGAGFRNLALAGDWIATPLNSGCLEAATMGGLAAGDAIVSGAVRP